MLCHYISCPYRSHFALAMRALTFFKSNQVILIPSRLKYSPFHYRLYFLSIIVLLEYRHFCQYLSRIRLRIWNLRYTVFRAWRWREATNNYSCMHHWSGTSQDNQRHGKPLLLTSYECFQWPRENNNFSFISDL